MKYPILSSGINPCRWSSLTTRKNWWSFALRTSLTRANFSIMMRYPLYAWEGVHIDTEELENDDGELDEEVQALIDEFRQKLRAIKRPIIYWESNTPIKVSENQLESWCAKVKGTLA